MLAGFLLANVALLVTAAALYSLRPAEPPLIQGVFLPEGRALPDFTLVDHRGNGFGNEDLLNQWHLVSYGFTTCPDVCPTTLSQLTAATARLEEYVDDLQILFYSVDHRRDTPQQLSSYLPFFDKSFIGLTHRDNPDNPHLPFEQGLGIVSELVPGESTSPDDYQVVHGVNLYLLNPQGELQAVFEPDEADVGVHVFDVEKLAADYVSVRRYLEG
jgi:protein SCO1/2